MGNDTRLWVLWCLNEWNGRAETLEEEIMHAVKVVKEKRDVGIVADDPILMDFIETESHMKRFKAVDFKPENIIVVQEVSVPSMHIHIPVIQRTPVKYIGKRNPI